MFWNRRYEPAAVARDIEVKSQLRADGLVAESFNGSLLREPWEIQNGTGHPYRVFTPFKRRVLADLDPPAPLRIASRWSAPRAWPESLSLDDLQLLPDIEWYQTMERTWKPGEAGAHARLRSFVKKPLAAYREDARSTRPGRNVGVCRHICTSAKSPSARCGTRCTRRAPSCASRRSCQSCCGASSRTT